MICVWLVGGVLWRYLVEFFARGSSRELLSGANNMVPLQQVKRRGAGALVSRKVLLRRARCGTGRRLPLHLQALNHLLLPLWESNSNHCNTNRAADGAATARNAPRGNSAPALVLHQRYGRLARATRHAAAPRRPRQGVAAAPQDDQGRHGRPHPHTSAQGDAHRRRGPRRDPRGGRGHRRAPPDRHDQDRPTNRIEFGPGLRQDLEQRKARGFL